MPALCPDPAVERRVSNVESQGPALNPSRPPEQCEHSPASWCGPALQQAALQEHMKPTHHATQCNEAVDAARRCFYTPVHTAAAHACSPTSRTLALTHSFVAHGTKWRRAGGVGSGKHSNRNKDPVRFNFSAFSADRRGRVRAPGARAERPSEGGAQIQVYKSQIQ